jgi:hypothetical protein
MTTPRIDAGAAWTIAQALQSIMLPAETRRAATELCAALGEASREALATDALISVTLGHETRP